MKKRRDNDTITDFKNILNINNFEEFHYVKNQNLNSELNRSNESSKSQIYFYNPFNPDEKIYMDKINNDNKIIKSKEFIPNIINTQNKNPNLIENYISESNKNKLFKYIFNKKDKKLKVNQKIYHVNKDKEILKYSNKNNNNIRNNNPLITYFKHHDDKDTLSSNRLIEKIYKEKYQFFGFSGVHNRDKYQEEIDKAKQIKANVYVSNNINYVKEKSTINNNIKAKLNEKALNDYINSRSNLASAKTRISTGKNRLTTNYNEYCSKDNRSSIKSLPNNSLMNTFSINNNQSIPINTIQTDKNVKTVFKGTLSSVKSIKSQNNFTLKDSNNPVNAIHSSISNTDDYNIHKNTISKWNKYKDYVKNSVIYKQEIGVSRGVSKTNQIDKSKTFNERSYSNNNNNTNNRNSIGEDDFYKISKEQDLRKSVFLINKEINNDRKYTAASAMNNKFSSILHKDKDINDLKPEVKENNNIQSNSKTSLNSKNMNFYEMLHHVTLKAKENTALEKHQRKETSKTTINKKNIIENSKLSQQTNKSLKKLKNIDVQDINQLQQSEIRENNSNTKNLKKRVQINEEIKKTMKTGTISSSTDEKESEILDTEEEEKLKRKGTQLKRRRNSSLLNLKKDIEGASNEGKKNDSVVNNTTKNSYNKSLDAHILKERLSSKFKRKDNIERYFKELSDMTNPKIQKLKGFLRESTNNFRNKKILKSQVQKLISMKSSHNSCNKFDNNLVSLNISNIITVFVLYYFLLLYYIDRL